MLNLQEAARIKGAGSSLGAAPRYVLLVCDWSHSTAPPRSRHTPQNRGSPDLRRAIDVLGWARSCSVVATAPSRRPCRSQRWEAVQLLTGAVDAALCTPLARLGAHCVLGVMHLVITGPYQVRRYVDAQNAFGAEIRTRFTCTVKRSGDSWHLLDLDLTSR